MADYYLTLGVTKTATADEIKSAYRKLAKLHHPDRNPGDPAAETKFKEVSEAYDVLTNPVKKSQYDSQGFVGRRRQPTPPPPQPPRRPKFDPADIFKHTKHVYGGGVERGSSIQIQMEVSLEEAAGGCTKRVTVNRRGVCEKCRGSGGTSFAYCQTCNGMGTQVFTAAFGNVVNVCPHCSGAGKKPKDACTDCLGFGFTPAKQHEVDMTLPAGIAHGMQVRIPNCGEPGKNGTPPGDLMVVVLVKEHPLYKLRGLDYNIDAWVSFTELVFGTEFTVPSLLKEGGVTIKIPPGTNSGTKFRVKRMGFKDVEGDVGDLMVVVRAETPKVIPEEYKAVLESLGQLEKTHVSTEREVFTRKLDEHTK